MDTKNLIVSDGKITGNVGSCSVQAQDVQVGIFHVRTIAVNSCSGQVIADNTYLSPGSVLFFIFGLTITIGIVLVSMLLVAYGRVIDALIHSLTSQV